LAFIGRGLGQLHGHKPDSVIAGLARLGCNMEKAGVEERKQVIIFNEPNPRASEMS